jgi:beta-glucosidase
MNIRCRVAGVALCLVPALGAGALALAQSTQDEVKASKEFPTTTSLTAKVTPVFASRRELYRRGWTDLNKNGRKDIYEDSTQPTERRIDDLLSQMTMDEKTAQMVTLYGFGRVLRDELPTVEWKQKIWKDGIGNIDEMHNGWGRGSRSIYATDIQKHVWAMNEVQRFFIEQTRLGIPVDFTNEGNGGLEAVHATSFPTQIGVGHTWDAPLVRDIGRVVGREARALGYTNVYAPILDVARDQRWGRMEEVYGEDPFLVSRFGVEMVSGLQEDLTVASTAKHFAVYSANKGAREGEARTDPQLSPREVENIHLPSFEAAIREAKLMGIMSSYNDYDGIPVTGSHYWLTDRLRTEFGFRGYVVSDSRAVEYLYSKHKVAAGPVEAAAMAVNAGLNVRTDFTPPEQYVTPLRAAVARGLVAPSTIDDRVRDILRVKFVLGIFDRPYVKDAAATARLVGAPEHRELALRASRESLVLLKNKDAALPLSKATDIVAVIGPNANNASYAARRYSPHGGKAITVLEGIRAKLGGKAEVRYAKGVDVVSSNWPRTETLPEPLSDAERTGVDEAVAAAKGAKVAVVVLGDNGLTVGESRSRTSLDLPGHQLELLKAVQATGTPVVLVLINGRPLSINWADENVPAILEAWFPGEQGGTAIADALFGDYNPGGKLTVTFPRTAGQIPLNFPTKPNAQWEGELSRTNGALYSFGHGLSYTQFTYSNLALQPATPNGDAMITVGFDLTNTGSREGDEVAQLYINDVVSSVITYEQQLRGFQRVHLKPGERRRIEFTLRRKDLALLNEKHQWVVEPGKFKIMVGAGSDDIRLTDIYSVGQ